MRRLLILIIVSLTTLGFAKQTGSDIPVITYLADVDGTNTAYYVQSDLSGAYTNGVNSVTSILVANGYNQIVDGDWRLDLFRSSLSLTAG
jgi:hypothetical protein